MSDEQAPQPGDVVFVRGKGGAINQITVPHGGIPLERFAEALERGDLSVVPDHFVEATTSRHGGTIYKIAGAPTAKVRPADDAPAAVSSDASGDTPAPPKKSAGVEAWRAYAVSHGMDPDAAEAADKATLVEQYGGS